MSYKFEIGDLVKVRNIDFNRRHTWIIDSIDREWTITDKKRQTEDGLILYKIGKYSANWFLGKRFEFVEKDYFSEEDFLV